jgi:hypothetical protein
MNWCENPHCSDPSYACKDLDEDLEAAGKLKALYPGIFFNCSFTLGSGLPDFS